ncbi:MAG: 30S ribosomal protein S13 [Candidatus Bathyarchaeia archaeon]
MPEKFQEIIRIAGANVDGTRKLPYALTEIKGVGISFAKAIVNKAGLNPNARLGFLSDKEVEEIEDILKNPTKHDVPGWLVNRQKDRETGESLHLIGSDIDLQVKSEIDRMKRIKSWKGYRHSFRLKVRGQRTKTTGRSQKSLGVKKKKIIEARRKL